MFARAAILSTAVMFLTTAASAQQSGGDSLLDLSGEWQFAAGDDLSWKTPGPDQGQWTALQVPGSWESQGFPEYDGFAWYRRAFKLPPSLRNADLILHLGRIDDSDEVFINGTFVGSSGSMPPTYMSAYGETREYSVPSSVVDPEGENIIAIRVFDERLDGGIMEGRIGLEPRAPTDGDLIRLDGVWSFRTGDNAEWAQRDTDKEGWSNITVPGTWEPQGHRDYDGYAWYRKEFFLPAQKVPGAYVLLLGKIDDLDQTFVNGVEVGHTGAIDHARMSNDEWQRQREYEVPAKNLLFGDYNVIAVRVFDGTGGGGMFEGPHALYPRSIDANTLQDRLEDLLHRVTGQ